VGVHEPVAVGGLPDGGWVGLVAGAEGFRIVVGGTGATAVDRGRLGQRRSTLTALAILHFEEALDAPSAGVDEATHREMADMLRWLGETAPSSEERELVALALDAVEDGLPGDAVSLRLMALLAAMVRGGGATNTTPDALEIVLARAREIRG
jgi:hypothetical protein